MKSYERVKGWGVAATIPWDEQAGLPSSIGYGVSKGLIFFRKGG